MSRRTIALRASVLGIAILVVWIAIRHDWLAELGAALAVIFPIERAVSHIFGINGNDKEKK